MRFSSNFKRVVIVLLVLVLVIGVVGYFFRFREGLQEDPDPDPTPPNQDLASEINNILSSIIGSQRQELQFRQSSSGTKDMQPLVKSFFSKNILQLLKNNGGIMEEPFRDGLGRKDEYIKRFKMLDVKSYKKVGKTIFNKIMNMKDENKRNMINFFIVSLNEHIIPPITFKEVFNSTERNIAKTDNPDILPSSSSSSSASD